VLRNLVPALACAVLLPMTSCRQPAAPDSELIVKSEISPSPAHVGPATITVQLSDPSMKPVTGASIGIEADMSHAGMAPAFSKSKEDGSGRYRGDIVFSMAGDWAILLHIALANGTKIERQIDVKGVSQN
jgi:hypothetical protein